MKYSGAYSGNSPLNKIAVLGAGITTFSVQIVTSGVANRFYQQGFQIVQSIATNIISSGMSVFVASVQRTNLEIMCILIRNTPSGITIYIEYSAMATPRQQMPNSRRAMFTKDSMCSNIFTVL
jgi:hypothetical protein